MTLVHGTIPRVGPIVFSRKQQWMESQSMFCREISTHLNPIWLPFTWSGSNSHSARIKAGKQLADTLHHNLARHPSIQHYVISHSHGGNVALYALKYLGEQERRRIAGIVTLGTPFIWSSMRDIATVRETLMTCLKYGPILWFILYIAVSLWLENLLTLLGAFPLAVGILGVIVCMVVRKYSVGTWEKVADEMDTLLDAGVPPVPLLCLLVNRDEAKIWIRVWESTGRILFGHWYMSVVEGATDIIAAIRTRWSFTLGQFGLVVYCYSLIATAVFCGVGLFFVLLISSGSALTISSSWAYGERWFHRWVVVITTGDTPHTQTAKTAWIFKSNLISLDLNRKNDDCFYKVQRFRPKSWSFNHGWLHDNIEVAASIARWILTQMREGVPANALRSE